MNNVLRLRCTGCNLISGVQPGGTLVMTGQVGKALFWCCPVDACGRRQWTTLPRHLSEAIRGGARVVFGKRKYATMPCAGCGTRQPVPLNQLATYTTSSGEPVVLWSCNVCRTDQTTGTDAEMVSIIGEAGGELLPAAAGAMIELLRTQDYQPHAAMAAAGCKFTTHHEGDQR